MLKRVVWVEVAQESDQGINLRLKFSLALGHFLVRDVLARTKFLFHRFSTGRYGRRHSDDVVRMELFDRN